MLERDEEEVVPHGKPHFVERIIATIETGNFGHVACSVERTVEAVRPSVVRTLNRSLKVSVRFDTKFGAAVTADVVKRMHPSGTIARHDQTLAGNVGEKVVSRVWNPFTASDADPVARKDALALAREVFR